GGDRRERRYDRHLSHCVPGWWTIHLAAQCEERNKCRAYDAEHDEEHRARLAAWRKCDRRLLAVLKLLQRRDGVVQQCSSFAHLLVKELPLTCDVVTVAGENGQPFLSIERRRKKRRERSLKLA